MTELEAAKLIAEGKLPSPYKHSNITLWAVKVTGTGMAYRTSIDEYVWRDP
jgi:colicin import membrane protein